MHKARLVLALGLFGTFAFGDTICDTSPVLGTVSDGTSLTGAGNCVVNGITFSNFTFTATTGFAANTPFSFSVGLNPNATTLDFHTTNMGGSGEDGVFNFQATPGISNITLGTGPADVVTESICSGPFNGIQCTGQTLNNSVLVSNNGTTASSTVNPAGTDYFFKDDSGGSDFFQTVASVPEPMTLTLMGAGLLGLGLFGRRRMRK
jgi:hypothetical protein